MLFNPPPPGRAALILSVALVILAHGLPPSPASAHSLARMASEVAATGYEPLPDFDLRVERRRAILAANAGERKQRLAASKTVISQATLRWNESLNVPHHLFSLSAPLSPKPQNPNDDPPTIARRFVAANHGIYGIEQSELDDARIAADERNQGFSRVALEQRVSGLRVFDGEMLVVLDADGRVVSASGSFIPQLAQRRLVSVPVLSVADGLTRAAMACGAKLNAEVTFTPQHLASRDRTVLASDEIDSRSEASLVYYPVTRDDIRLAYQVLLYGMPLAADAYLILVDANSGEILRRDALTQAFAAPGRVFPKENPVTGGREIIPLAGDPRTSPQGWVSADRTEGNNARVYFDPYLTGGDSVRANAGTAFDFPLDLARSPLESSSASATNLFYWLNIAHDHFYALGFNEAARNFQANNFGNGGAGGDPVRGDTLRGAGLDPSTTAQLVRNNAYFSPTLDGTPPLLAMLMWNVSVNGSTVDLDSSYDAGVIVHEYTHGVSTRLAGTDNALGLRSTQGSGMGEGWSDFFAMSLLTGDDRALDAPAATGSYITQRDRGVRAYPYCTRIDVDPLTFGDIRFGTEVHALGTVWCSMLWDMRQLFIGRYGFEAGRSAAEQVVIDGLKVTPLAPTFVDARDAILLADKTTNGGANQDLIWCAFAGRGMGKSASTDLVTNGIGYRIAAVESYDIPPAATAGALTVNDQPGAPIVIGENVNLIVSDRDLQNASSVEIHIRNPRLSSDVRVTLLADAAGHFSATVPVLSPGGEGGTQARIVAAPGDDIVIDYANARNDAGQAEVIEKHVTAGRRVTIYSTDFEHETDGWVLTDQWHLTTRRAAGSAQSLYFAKRKGQSDNKAFTPVGSSGTAFAPAVDLRTLAKPQLEFDYYFSGVTADLLSVSARNYPLLGGGTTMAGEPPMGLVYDLRPPGEPAFQSGKIDLHFLGKNRACFSFAFAASPEDINRKRLEGFYLDNVRVTAVSMQ